MHDKLYLKRIAEGVASIESRPEFTEYVDEETGEVTFSLYTRLCFGAELQADGTTKKTGPFMPARCYSVHAQAAADLLRNDTQKGDVVKVKGFTRSRISSFVDPATGEEHSVTRDVFYIQSAEIVEKAKPEKPTTDQPEQKAQPSDMGPAAPREPEQEAAQAEPATANNLDDNGTLDEPTAEPSAKDFVPF